MAAMTKEDCEKKHGAWARNITVIVTVVTAIGMSAFLFAFNANREVGEVKTQGVATEKRVDRVERSIEEGFDRVIKAMRAK